MKMFIWTLILALSVVPEVISFDDGTSIEVLEKEYPDLKADAENVCVDQKLENVIINVTFMQTMDVKEYTWCLQVPPRCPVYKQKLVESVKQENVSRLVNHRKCCPGYKVSDSKTCEPICEEPCEHGVCFEPNACSCTPGFTGKRCEKFGCPEGNWGPNCANKCPCVNGGSCEANTGKCLCLPGWTGLHCQSKCDAFHFGADCNSKCQCKEVGEKCYHVTGDCLPCSSGTWGSYCSKSCSCNSTGTALCYHLNGNCFCHANWYGPKCDLFCPFGYVNGICYNEPMNNETLCSCPGDMYECDPKIGCICNEEKNCQGGQQIFSLAPLSAAEDPGTSQSSAIAIVVTVLILALLLTILGIWYYRRRTKILQKDLQNRSVYYVENSILDPARHHHNQNDLIIPNSDPVILEDEFEGPPLVGTATAALTTTAATANNVPNNLLAKPRFEKNVNIDAFKLGMDSESPIGACGRNTPVNTGACGRNTPLSGGACGGVEDGEFPEVIPKKPLNVNMFDDVESPIKNNFLLEHNRKINKPKINNVINNTLEEDDVDIDTNDDEIAIAKMSNYLGSYPDPEKK